MQRKTEQIKEICEALLASDNIPYAYDHFTETGAAAPPFILYRRVAAQNFSADGGVYYKGENIDLELYTATPEEMTELMDKIEQLLDAKEIYYDKTADTVYITTEDFYESLYEI